MPTSAKPKAKIIVFGILFWYPLAGVTFQFLHYIIALRRLGYDVYYVEDSGRWVYDPATQDVTPDARRNVACIAQILDSHGFAGRWAFRGAYAGGECYGMTAEALERLYAEADGFLNITGAQELREEHMKCPRRIYVETDPVAVQVAVAQGNKDTIATLEQHDMHFTFGENIGAADCGVPNDRFHWLPTRQPVLLDFWEPAPPDSKAAYTTIASWKNEGKDISFQGETYRWSKHHEFLKIIDLPKRSPAPFELATHVEENIAAQLHANGWRLRDALVISTETEPYRSFIRSSRGEFTVAKDQNIRLRSGWFSDRSACYLAAGRPVITQETGFSNILPSGAGLFGFAVMDDILRAVETIENAYDAHCRAARDIAEEYFAAEKVVSSLMARAGF